jgi:hypothetical protein
MKVASTSDEPPDFAALHHRPPEARLNEVGVIVVKIASRLVARAEKRSDAKSFPSRSAFLGVAPDLQELLELPAGELIRPIEKTG